VPHGQPTISTHVLDTVAGRAAAGIRVRCWFLDGDDAVEVGDGLTDGDGRIDDLLGKRVLEAGRYRLAFELGQDRYFETATLEIRLDDATRSHHVPLLLSPYGLTAYRGS
jgi:5-hydroxyisourate hydrolase